MISAARNLRFVCTTVAALLLASITFPEYVHNDSNRNHQNGNQIAEGEAVRDRADGSFGSHGGSISRFKDKASAGHSADSSGAEYRIDDLLASMSEDEKIGQLIVPATVGMFLGEDSVEFQDVQRNIVEFHVGGYHLLGDVNQLHDPAGAALLVNHMQKLSKLPLFITADFEGGVGYRYEGATRLPRAMAMGATGSEELAYSSGQVTAEEGRAIGANVNFYPVVDVNNNPENPIINIRSFGSDPNLVSRMAAAYIRGLQSAGEMATAKHYPGHGDTSVDSHLELPIINVDRSRLDHIELPPFKAAIDQEVGGVMSAHIALPQIDPSGLPATLSKKILTGILRQEMGFKGVIFTDALMMRGISAHYPDGEAAVRAIEAGADEVLYPPNVEQAFKAIKQAVDSGRVQMSRIEASDRRILEAKDRLGLNRERFADLSKLDQVLGSKAHMETAEQIMENAITLVRNENNTFPLKLDPAAKVLLVIMLDNNDGWAGSPPGSRFEAELKRRHDNTTTVTISDRTSPAEYSLIRKLVGLSDVVIACGFIRIAAFKGSVGMPAEEMGLLQFLGGLKKPLAFISFGSPYIVSHLPELPTCVLTYEYYDGAEQAALKSVLGEIPFKGKLPVELPGLYPLGYSYQSPRESRKRGSPKPAEGLTGLQLSMQHILNTWNRIRPKCELLQSMKLKRSSPDFGDCCQRWRQSAMP
ncbi:MAG TPA: glycoside hydrolase family 3 N-terminal domain-containing protein [Blastocatellia bacterium]|nr:glycoside hydrolase family 3 N-terminal domain-containing protein [Blastocatellia bacterium]